MSNELTRINEQLPAFMQGTDPNKGKEGLKQYISPPRIKITQPTSKGPFAEYPQGTVLLMPHMIELLRYTSKEEGYSSIALTPLFFFVEYVKMNGLGLQPTFLERTYNPASRIAIMSRDPKTRVQPHPDFPNDVKKAIKFREHLNWAVLLHMEGLATSPAVITFASAEHYHGRVFSDKVNLRPCAPFGCNFVAVLKQRDNAEGKWYGFDIMNPPGDSGIPPFVQDEEEFKRNEAIHDELQQAFETNSLQMADDDEIVEPYLDEYQDKPAHGTHADEAF